MWFWFDYSNNSYEAYKRRNSSLCGLDAAGSIASGFCEDDNEPLVSIKVKQNSTVVDEGTAIQSK